MQSTKKTTVAVLRTQMGISAEAFAELIGKSLGAVNSLETGRLALSEETADTIYEQTGVSLEWLLEGKPDEAPYWFDHVDGRKRPWTKEMFEQIQAHKDIDHSAYRDHRPAWRLVRALIAVGPWFGIFAQAQKDDKEELAKYLLKRFLKELAERLGTDKAGANRLCEGASLSLRDGSEFSFQPEEGQLYLRLESKP
jgi:transcriptional regulator with XRE-family HTH domain